MTDIRLVYYRARPLLRLSILVSISILDIALSGRFRIPTYIPLVVIAANSL